jgi:hypothetical protein
VVATAAQRSVDPSGDMVTLFGAMTLIRLILVALVAIAAGAATAPPASAATCADFSNQAAAQRAGNTRDADGDGVYCESLPCPCSSVAGSGGSSAPKPAQPKPAAPKRPKLGRPILLGRHTKTTGCHVRGSLPDPACTPGAVYPGATTGVMCRSGYSATVRNVPESVKEKVYATYGITSHRQGQYEMDHLVPLEGGGSNSIANLFPEAASPVPGFHEKDRVENAMRARACNNGGLRSLQRQMARNWVTLYDRLVA